MQQDKYIKNLLDQLNNAKALNGYIVTRKLSESVHLVRIWTSDDNDTPTDIYLLKEKENYMGAIQEQETELYAYITPTFRRKGCMKTALKETVLPHLLQRTPILRVTISRSLLSEKMYVAGKHLALASGFEILKEENGQCRFLLDGTKMQKRIYIPGENVPLTLDEKSNVKRLINKSVLYSSIAQSMMEYREGRSSLSEDLLEVTKKICMLSEKLN